MSRRDLDAIDATFRAAGLEPLAEYVRTDVELECRCTKCGTLRRVKLTTLRRGGIACRWCHGWDKWESWYYAAAERARSRGYGFPGTPKESLERLEWEDLDALTPLGTLYLPVGVRCRRCGETFVTVPSKIHQSHPGWFGCPRCFEDRKRAIRADAPRMFAEHGLELLGSGGEHARRHVRCVKCGADRWVSYRQLATDSAPECWSCKTGIDPSSPHRVYLFHFEDLHVMKVGITHSRDDRRLDEHVMHGGRLIVAVALPDRACARRLEQAIRATYRDWRTQEVGGVDFPQGGW